MSVALPHPPRPRSWWQSARSRVATSAWPTLMAAVTAGVAYLLSGWLWNHQFPFFSCVTAFLIIGFTFETKIRKSIELSAGMLFGIFLGEAMRSLVGFGSWQVGLTILVAVGVARLVGGGALFTMQTGMQSIVVLLLPKVDGMDPSGRALDALTGIALGLLVHMVFASDPRQAQRRAARGFFVELGNALQDLGDSARRGDAGHALTTLATLRASSQEHTDAWALANDAADELASISPTRHRHSDQVNRLRHLLLGSDRAMRNARVIARRQVELLRVTNGAAFPNLAAAFDAATSTVHLLHDAVVGDVTFTRVRRQLRDLCKHLTPEELLATEKGELGRLGYLEGISLLIEMRGLASDLLEATGLSSSEARKFLPSLVVSTGPHVIGPKARTAEMDSVEPPLTTAAIESLIVDDRHAPTEKGS